jgi:hypothetical protein
MEYFLGALAVFWLWTLLQIVVSAPEWFWYVAITVFGLVAGLLIDSDSWYWGLGVTGGSLLLRRLDDLLLTTSDRARVEVLRHTKR